MIIKCDPKPVASFSINIGNNQIAQTIVQNIQE